MTKEEASFNPEIINPDVFGWEVKSLIEALNKNEAGRYGVEILAPAAKIPRGEAGIPARDQELELLFTAAGGKENLADICAQQTGSVDLLEATARLVFPYSNELAAELERDLFREGYFILGGDPGETQQLHQAIIEQLAVVDIDGQGAGEGTLLNRCLRIMILKKQGQENQVKALQEKWARQRIEGLAGVLAIDQKTGEMKNLGGLTAGDGRTLRIIEDNYRLATQPLWAGRNINLQMKVGAKVHGLSFGITKVHEDCPDFIQEDIKDWVKRDLIAVEILDGQIQIYPKEALDVKNVQQLALMQNVVNELVRFLSVEQEIAVNLADFGGEVAFLASQLIRWQKKESRNFDPIEALAVISSSGQIDEAALIRSAQEQIGKLEAIFSRNVRGKNWREFMAEIRQENPAAPYLMALARMIFPQDEYRPLRDNLYLTLYGEGWKAAKKSGETDQNRTEDMIWGRLAIIDDGLLERCLKLNILEKQKDGLARVPQLEQAWREGQGTENPSAAVVIEEFNRQMKEISGEEDSWAEIKDGGIIVTKEIVGRDREEIMMLSVPLQKILDLAGEENPVEVLFQENLYLTDAVIRGGKFQSKVYLEGRSSVTGGSFSDDLDLDDSSLFVGGEIKSGDIYIYTGFKGVILLDGKVYARENINRGHSGYLLLSGEIDRTAIGKDKLKEFDARIINLSEEENGVEVESQKATIINKGREVIIFVPRDGGWEWYTAGTTRRDGLFSSSELRDKLAEVGLKLGAILPEAAVVTVPEEEEKSQSPKRKLRKSFGS